MTIKIIQVVSNDDEIIDFAIIINDKKAKIYSLHVSSLHRSDFKDKLDEYIELSEMDVPVKQIKKIKKNTIDNNMFNIIYDYLLNV